jgi:hypothetical protein
VRRTRVHWGSWECRQVGTGWECHGHRPDRSTSLHWGCTCVRGVWSWQPAESCQKAALQLLQATRSLACCFHKA